MTLEKSIKILMPEYLLKFSCIGGMCEDSCCIGWTVTIDKKTFKAYKNNNSLKLKKLFNQFIVRNRNNKTDHNYGRIKMDQNNNCPFLSESKLCRIHAEEGEALLSDTCYFYPRSTNRINTTLEVCASVSCPEITRLALLEPEPMGFLEINQDLSRPFKLSYLIENTNNFDEENEPLHYFLILRIFVITILQDRRYSLDERFLLLGIVINKVTRLQESNQLRKLPMLLEEYQAQFDGVEDIKKLINVTDNNIRAPFSKNFIRQVSDPNILINFPNQRYYECILEITNGLKLEDNNLIYTQELYMNAYSNYYEPFIQEKEYILENYIVNEVFKELYPFAKLKTINESYIMLLTLYNLIKFHLIGISAYHKSLDDDIVIKMIQSFTRVILHHNDYLSVFKAEI